MKKYQNYKLHLLYLLIIVFSLNNIEITAKEQKKSLLWKVENTKTHNYSYLLGSIHIGKKDMYPLANYIENAYNDSKSLVLEVDISQVNPMSMMKLMTFQDTSTLKGKLKPATYQKIKKVFDENNLPEMMYSKLKPWAAILTAQQLSMKDMLNEDIAPGIDMYFVEKAGKDKKQIEQLETAEFQMGLFDDFNLIADEYIDFSLEEMENDEEFEKIINAYKAGDAEALNDLINKSKDDFPEYEKILEKILYERNTNMTQKISDWLSVESKIEENKVRFIVVGAGHLVGKKSIIDLLNSNKDYKITNIVE